MNLRRGLFRLWGAVTVLWIGVTGSLLWGIVFNPWPGELVKGPTRLEAVMVVFLPPVALLALGIMGKWVARGFADD